MAVEWTTTIEGRNEFGDNCRRHQLTLVGLERNRTTDPFDRLTPRHRLYGVISFIMHREEVHDA